MGYIIDTIEVRDRNRQIIELVNDATSIIWQTEYIGTGNFQIIVPYTAERFANINVGNYITRPDRTELGFIENVTMSYTVTEGRLITASGRFGCVLLERRIWADINASAHKCLLNSTNSTVAADAVVQIVDETLINPDWNVRKVAWLSSYFDITVNETTGEHESTYQNVLELASDILQNAMSGANVSPVGQKVVFDRDALTAVYTLYKGVQRYIIFSQSYNNLLTFEYSYDNALYKNGFLIAGDGEGASRFYTHRNRNTSLTGERRREYCFESNKSKTYNDKNGNQQTYTDAQYETLLKNDCAAHFSDYATQKKITGTVDLQQYEYQTDYNVGDLVTIRDDATQLNTTARIWSVTEVQDENGYTITANFEGE